MKKENLGSVKALKKQLGAAVAMVCVAAVALGSSTYAWFVTNTKVTAGKAEMTATAANTLLISAAGQNEWATSYDFTDTNTTFAPVSTVGTDDGTVDQHTQRCDNQKTSSGYNRSHEVLPFLFSYIIFP